MTLQIPHTELSDEALRGLIDEFITRDSAIWDGTLEQKRARVKKSLDDGDAVITFDPEQKTAQIWSKQEFLNTQQKSNS